MASGCTSRAARGTTAPVLVLLTLSLHLLATPGVRAGVVVRPGASASPIGALWDMLERTGRRESASTPTAIGVEDGARSPRWSESTGAIDSTPEIRVLERDLPPPGR